MKDNLPDVPLTKQRIYTELAEAIFAQQLPPGESLVEAALAQQYGVSRTPIREALALLVADGLVEVVPRRGYFVTAVTLEEILESFQVRLLLEPEAAALAANRISPSALAELQALDATYLDGKRPIAVANYQWHTAVADASGNRRLARLIRHLLDDTRRIVLLDPYMRQPPDIEEHEQVTAAIARRDPDGSRQAMRAHLESGRSRVLQSFQVGGEWKGG